MTVRSRGNDMEASATISNAADRRVDDGQADSLTGCDDASTENGAPGASVREMTNAVRTAEPVQGPSSLAPTPTNARPFTQSPGLGLGATQALSGQGDKSCAAVHSTRITVMSTGAGDDAMEVEAGGDTAH